MIIFTWLTDLFDILHHYIEHPKTERFISISLVIIFLVGILGIELNRQGLLPFSLAKYTPDNHFQSVNLAFTLILALEVIALVFAISNSVSRAIGKQLEILSLIFLRDAFKEVSKLGEPINAEANMEAIVHIALYGVSALLIFICINIYYRIQSSQKLIRNPLDKLYYVMAKKVIALFLFFAFIGMAFWVVYAKLNYDINIQFFEGFYTILIFADILLVLVGQIFMHTYYAAFRASGYVVTTMLMRLAIGAPELYDMALGLFATLFCLALTWATTRFSSNSQKT
ncbi:hypothetical protein [Desulfovibrio litoralis]|uniref:Uncharacterized protein n=1 Tax=Desulfovibrio litoralis DSM 11393 TaxID=1121455 RepID=A0A1M7TDH8_9BACT|nr:hypothetical protein [Desulfovibrio litoralis]SHN68772.1 hypothetical protein SAMN02745728_01888 [Desulfovibrio litoralis DSM 11393]